MNSLRKYYQILELNHNATKEQIKKAYRKLAKKWHPDNYNDNYEKQKIAQQKFIDISTAYQILINHDKNEDIETTKSSNKTTVKSKSNNVSFYYNLGVEAAENENWTEAINYFSQAIKIDNSFSEAYFYRGIVLEKQGFVLRAKGDFDKFKNLQSDRLNNIWSKVIDALQCVTAKQLCYQGLQLISLNNNVAVLSLTNKNLLRGAKEKISDFEQAFSQVCGHPTKVKFEEKVRKYNVHKWSKSSTTKRYSGKDKKQNIGKFVISFFVFMVISLFLLDLSQRVKFINDHNNELDTVPSSPYSNPI